MRVLIIRFSSFGDIFQALEAAKHLAKSGPVEFVDWIVRADFAPLLQNQEFVRNVHSFPRSSSVFRLIALSWKLAPLYDHVYDAHSNVRSLVMRWTIRIRWLFLPLINPPGPRRSILRRSKERIRRFLFFKFRLQTLPVPYRGAESFLRPLRKWLPNLEFDFSDVGWRAPTATSESANFSEWRKRATAAPLIALAPSAAWPNKRWPVERWRIFVKQWIEVSNDSRFLLLGGPEDQFLHSIAEEFGPDRVFDAVGSMTLLESARLVSYASAIVANDTGLLHVADRLQIPSVAIIGPTAFGYTTSPVSRIAEVPRESLYCKPCSKDGRDQCINNVHLKCLIDVKPEQVIRELKEAFERKGESRALS